MHNCDNKLMLHTNKKRIYFSVVTFSEYFSEMQKYASEMVFRCTRTTVMHDCDNKLMLHTNKKTIYFSVVTFSEYFSEMQKICL